MQSKLRMNALTPFVRPTMFLQRAAAKRTTTRASYRFFSSTIATNDTSQKLTEKEVAASVRLLTYQGTPFPWVAVRFVPYHESIHWSAH